MRGIGLTLQKWDERCGSSAESSDCVAQASGMVSVQANCSLVEAITLMKRLAFDTDCTLDEIATLVIEREVRLDG